MGLAVLEKINENLSNAPTRIAVEEERSEFRVDRNPGDCLEAGLAADQAWRGEREEVLRHKFGRLHRLDAMAHHWAVIAGFLETLTLVLAAVTTQVDSDAVVLGAIGMGTACLGLLAISSAAVSISAWMRRRLLKNAERNAVALPTSAPAETGEHEREARFEQLEEKVRRAYRDERNLSEVCLWSGHGALTIGGSWRSSWGHPTGSCRISVRSECFCI